MSAARFASLTGLGCGVRGNLAAMNQRYAVRRFSGDKTALSPATMVICMNRLRIAIVAVAALNALYCVVEFAVAVSIGSASLLADSVDFFEDAAINTLVLLSLSWPLARRVKLARVLSGVILIPAAAALWTIAAKIMKPLVPSTAPLTMTALGALAVNLVCAALLVTARRKHGSTVMAAWLAARNDALANIAIVLAAALTFVVPTGWFDIVVAAGIIAINADAAIKVWRASNRELVQGVEPQA